MGKKRRKVHRGRKREGGEVKEKRKRQTDEQVKGRREAETDRKRNADRQIGKEAETGK